MPVKSKPKKATQKQIVSAAARKHGIPPWLLWGIYGAESTYGTNGTNYFGLFEGSYNGRTVHSTTNLAEDADIAAELLASLKREHGGLAGAVTAYSGGEYDISHPRSLSTGGKSSGSQFVSFGGGLPEGELAEEIAKGALGLGSGPVGQAIGGATNKVTEGAANALGLGGVTTFMRDLSLMIFTPAGWLQIGQVSAGVILIGWGMHHIIQTASGINPTHTVAKTATKAAELAAVIPK